MHKSHDHKKLYTLLTQSHFSVVDLEYVRNTNQLTRWIMYANALPSNFTKFYNQHIANNPASAIHWDQFETDRHIGQRILESLPIWDELNRLDRDDFMAEFHRAIECIKEVAIDQSTDSNEQDSDTDKLVSKYLPYLYNINKTDYLDRGYESSKKVMTFITIAYDYAATQPEGQREQAMNLLIQELYDSMNAYKGTGYGIVANMDDEEINDYSCNKGVMERLCRFVFLQERLSGRLLESADEAYAKEIFNLFMGLEGHILLASAAWMAIAGDNEWHTVEKSMKRLVVHDKSSSKDEVIMVNDEHLPKYDDKKINTYLDWLVASKYNEITDSFHRLTNNNQITPKDKLGEKQKLARHGLSFRESSLYRGSDKVNLKNPRDAALLREEIRKSSYKSVINLLRQGLYVMSQDGLDEGLDLSIKYSSLLDVLGFEYMDCKTQICQLADGSKDPCEIFSDKMTGIDMDDFMDRLSSVMGFKKDLLYLAMIKIGSMDDVMRLVNGLFDDTFVFKLSQSKMKSQLGSARRCLKEHASQILNQIISGKHEMDGWCLPDFTISKDVIEQYRQKGYFDISNDGQDVILLSSLLESVDSNAFDSALECLNTQLLGMKPDNTKSYMTFLLQELGMRSNLFLKNPSITTPGAENYSFLMDICLPTEFLVNFYHNELKSVQSDLAISQLAYWTNMKFIINAVMLNASITANDQNRETSRDIELSGDNKQLLIDIVNDIMKKFLADPYSQDEYGYMILMPYLLVDNHDIGIMSGWLKDADIVFDVLSRYGFGFRVFEDVLLPQFCQWDEFRPTVSSILKLLQCQSEPLIEMKRQKYGDDVNTVTDNEYLLFQAMIKYVVKYEDVTGKNFVLSCVDQFESQDVAIDNILARLNEIVKYHMLPPNPNIQTFFSLSTPLTEDIVGEVMSQIINMSSVGVRGVLSRNYNDHPELISYLFNNDNRWISLSILEKDIRSVRDQFRSLYIDAEDKHVLKLEVARLLDNTMTNLWSIQIEALNIRDQYEEDYIVMRKSVAKQFQTMTCLFRVVDEMDIWQEIAKD